MCQTFTSFPEKKNRVTHASTTGPEDRYETLADKALSLQLGGVETRQRLEQRRLDFFLVGGGSRAAL